MPLLLEEIRKKSYVISILASTGTPFSYCPTVTQFLFLKRKASLGEVAQSVMCQSHKH